MPSHALEGRLRQDGAALGWLSRLGGNAIAALMVALVVGGGAAAGVATVLKPAAGIGIVVAIGVGLLIFRRLDIGGLVLVAAVPILSGLRRGLPIPRLRLTEALTVAVAAAVFVTLRRVHARPWTRVEWGLALFVAVWIGFGILDARQLGYHPSLTEYGTIIGPLQFFLLYRAVRLVLPGPASRRLALRALLFASLPVAGLAVLQQANVPGVRRFIASYTGSDVFAGTGSGYQTFARATGPFPHWTPLSGYLLVLLLVGIALYLEHDADVMSRRSLLIVLSLDAVALLLTAELSAILGLVGGTLLLGAWFHQFRRVLRVMAVAVVGLSIAAGPLLVSRLHREYAKAAGTNRSSLVPQTLLFRWQIWTHQYFPAIAQRPLDGYGVVVPPTVVWPATESQYVTLLEWGGAPQLAAYAVLLGALATAARSRARSGDAVSRVTGNSVLAVVVVLVPMGTIFPYFEDSGLPQALWALAAIMMGGLPRRLPAVGKATVLAAPLEVPAPAAAPALAATAPRSGT